MRAGALALWLWSCSGGLGPAVPVGTGCWSTLLRWDAYPAGAPFLPKKWGKEGQGERVSYGLRSFALDLTELSPGQFDPWIPNLWFGETFRGVGLAELTGLRPMDFQLYGPAPQLGRAGVSGWGPWGGGWWGYYLRRGILDARPHPTRPLTGPPSPPGEGVGKPCRAYCRRLP